MASDYSCEIRKHARMVTNAERLAWVNEQVLDYGKKADLTRHLGITQDKLTKSLKGKREFTPDEWGKIAQYYGKPIEEFIASGSTIRLIPVIGTIGLGGAVTFLSDFHLSSLTAYMSENKIISPYRAQGDEMSLSADMVDAPPGISPNRTRAFRIIDDSNFPTYKKGELIYPELTDDTNPASYINEECLICLVDDKCLIATIAGSAKTNYYILNRTNAPAIANAEIKWALPIYAHIKRPRTEKKNA